MVFRLNSILSQVANDYENNERPDESLHPVSTIIFISFFLCSFFPMNLCYGSRYLHLCRCHHLDPFWNPIFCIQHLDLWNGHWTLVCIVYHDTVFNLGFIRSTSKYQNFRRIVISFMTWLKRKINRMRWHVVLPHHNYRIRHHRHHSIVIVIVIIRTDTFNDFRVYCGIGAHDYRFG